MNTQLDQNTKVLVTGNEGFIGRWVCRRLDEKGLNWVGLSLEKKDERTRQMDLRDGDALERLFAEERPTAVIHLAARCDLDGATLDDYATNSEGVLRLCEAIRKTSSVKRAIFTSSQLVCKVGYVPKSSTDYCPHTLYGESKVQTEEIVRDCDGGGCEWCLVRPTTVWGPGMGAHYQSLLRHIARGLYFHSGSSALLKSYAYAGNIAFQYGKLLEAGVESISRNVFYLADYEPLSLRDYINQLALAFGVRKPMTVPLPIARGLAWGGDLLGCVGLKVPFNSFRLRNIRTQYLFDLSTTQSVCGLLPFSFEEGVQATAQWFMRENPDLFS